MAPKTSTQPRKSAGKSPLSRSPSPRQVSREQIAMRAYELYLARAGGPGDEVSDWLRAESELVNDRRPSASV